MLLYGWVPSYRINYSMVKDVLYNLRYENKDGLDTYSIIDADSGYMYHGYYVPSFLYGTHITIYVFDTANTNISNTCNIIKILRYAY